MSAPPCEIVILGAGGHARVVLAALDSLGASVIGCIALQPPDARWPACRPWLGGDEALGRLDPEKVRLANGIGSVADTALRRRVFDEACAGGFRFATIRHPAACVDPAAELGEGTQVMAGAVLQTGVRTGRNVIVNTGAIVDHDGAIGDHAHLAPGVRLSGSVSVGPGAHIGTGAVVIQGVAIGAEATVGAGAVVLRDVPARLTVVGNPARAHADRRSPA